MGQHLPNGSQAGPQVVEPHGKRRGTTTTKAKTAAKTKVVNVKLGVGHRRQLDATRCWRPENRTDLVGQGKVQIASVGDTITCSISFADAKAAESVV